MTQTCTLHIDTSKTQETCVALYDDNHRYEMQTQRASHTSQDVLLLIEKLLREQKKIWSDITSISVVEGPGSYTGLRVGAAVGMMLSILLNVPLNDTPPGTVIVPQYEHDVWK